MKRSEINAIIKEARAFFASQNFNLPQWIDWSEEEWKTKGTECAEIKRNGLGWDVTDFATGNFNEIGLTAITVRNGNLKYDRKTYCEKLMMVRVNQVTPIHFHWKKMEDIINRAGGDLCMKLWKADEAEALTNEDVVVQIDGVTTTVKAGELLRMKPVQVYPLNHMYIIHSGRKVLLAW
jgi:D-lyxose ketol-isomerase